jgi:hypothetical protein
MGLEGIVCIIAKKTWHTQPNNPGTKNKYVPCFLKKYFLRKKIRIDSGVLRVARGGSGAKLRLPRAQLTPPPNSGCFCVIFVGWSQILHSTKLFRRGFEQSCSAMATKKLEEQIQQQNEDAKSENLAKLAAGAHQRHKPRP